MELTLPANGLSEASETNVGVGEEPLDGVVEEVEESPRAVEEEEEKKEALEVAFEVEREETGDGAAEVDFAEEVDRIKDGMVVEGKDGGVAVTDDIARVERVEEVTAGTALDLRKMRNLLRTHAESLRRTWWIVEHLR